LAPGFQLLLDLGADVDVVDVVDERGRSRLATAVINGEAETCKVKLESCGRSYDFKIYIKLG
jgi:hypothetical protein